MTDKIRQISKLTGNPKPCYNEKIHSDKFIITMCLFSPNRTQQAKRTFLHRCKTPFFVVSNEKNADIA